MLPSSRVSATTLSAPSQSACLRYSTLITSITVATMHTHLDHDQCLETVMLKGPVKTVREFADALIAARGVRHGQLNVISVDLGTTHRHGGAGHRHLKPRH